ncbi:MAG: hypothetical protein ACK583_13710 [Cyanobacteriota bacterium]
MSIAAPGLWLPHVLGCSRSVAAPCPLLLQVCGCPRSEAALLLVSCCWSPGLLAAGLLDSWLLDSWLLDFWLLVYLQTIRHILDLIC